MKDRAAKGDDNFLFFYFSDVNHCWTLPGENTDQTEVLSHLSSASAAFQRGAGELWFSVSISSQTGACFWNWSSSIAVCIEIAIDAIDLTLISLFVYRWRVVWPRTWRTHLELWSGQKCSENAFKHRAKDSDYCLTCQYKNKIYSVNK